MKCLSDHNFSIHYLGPFQITLVQYHTVYSIHFYFSQWNVVEILTVLNGQNYRLWTFSLFWRNLKDLWLIRTVMLFVLNYGLGNYVFLKVYNSKKCETLLTFKYPIEFSSYKIENFFFVSKENKVRTLSNAAIMKFSLGLKVHLFDHNPK